jgi:serine/threonine protein phosphatase PrpC
VPGAAHLRSGKPNQDAIRWLPPDAEGERVVMAVADGHGSPACPRSGLGARFAVEIATEVLWPLHPLITLTLMADAITAIVSRWTARVLEHLARHPLTAAEIGYAGEVDQRGRPTLIYGATLLFAVVTLENLALGQLGDGDVVVVDQNGRAARPLPADDRLVANVTTSLSDDDAVGSVRTAILETDGSRLVLLATDGYANSFANDDAFLQVGTDVLEMVDAQGIELIRSSLRGWLAETTQEGAGDDIAVTIAVLDPPECDEADDPPSGTAGHPLR